MSSQADQSAPASRYDFAALEAKWRPYWDELGLYQTGNDPAKPKKYVLDFFPYPSGEGLSVGHCRNYVPTDVISRYFRMRHFNVLHPIGWDAFGLPAENAAIKLKTNPARLIAKYSANYKRQMNLIAASYDWDREINSSSPEYYRWTQWIFLLLYNSWYDRRRDQARPIAELEAELERHGTQEMMLPAEVPALTGTQWRAMPLTERRRYLSNFRLAYRAASAVNWDPVEKTVLANEEVIDGRGWRSGALVERKNLQQWFFRITAYAERLLADLDTIDWPESIKAMQRNWIGRSEGAEVTFKTAAGDLVIFTTRPDTLWGATFMVLAPEHPFVSQLTTAAQRSQVTAYVAAAKEQSEQTRTAETRDKTGVFTGSYALNPVNQEQIPIWIADYVLLEYGTGAIMAVPAHDQRDFEFARKFDLPIRVVIEPAGQTLRPEDMTAAWPHEGVMVNSAHFDGTPANEAVSKVIVWLEQTGKGSGRVLYKMRDWLISRQRYWGTPIPIVHTEAFGEVPVAPENLPVVLPEVPNYEPTETGESPLAAITSFVNVTLPDGTSGKRETDTMGTFACSSWYFLRFASPREDQAPFEPQAVNYWLPIDLYVGGAEHAVMHLLYSRFWTKVLYDRGLVPFVEPFKKLRNQGMLLSYDNQKMSKSRGNVITPDAVAAVHGVDALRVYILFMGPFEAETKWEEAGVKGASRFLQRFWTLARELATATFVEPSGEREREFRRTLHATIKRVTHDLEDFAFNTAIAGLMELLNFFYDCRRDQTVVGVTPGLWREGLEVFTRLLSPIAPFLAEEVWQEMLGHRGECVQRLPWLEYDEAALAVDEITVVIQVNGKLRGQLTVPVAIDEERLKQAALASAQIKKFVEGKAIKKVIVVPRKLVNIVVG
ncbi:MAG: Leucine--tRNA ligase [bacterium]|nr:Leucine--tRNA ligase [bacterium]